MFLQVRVDPKDTDVLRLLWWPDNDLTKEPIELQMLVHIFGATSSPTCANFSLRKVAEDHKNEYDAETTKAIDRNFYVDDLLKSTETVTDAKKLVREITELLQKGGFRLTKWISNQQ
jgi:hypothetical protein